MGISAPNLGNLLNYASYRGINEFYLKEFLLNNTLDLWNPKNSVTENEFLTLFDELIHSTEDPYFGLHYGCYLNINAMRFIADLSMNATHIEQAVFILQNYLSKGNNMKTQVIAHILGYSEPSSYLHVVKRWGI